MPVPLVVREAGLSVTAHPSDLAVRLGVDGRTCFFLSTGSVAVSSQAKQSWRGVEWDIVEVVTLFLSPEPFGFRSVPGLPVAFGGGEIMGCVGDTFGPASRDIWIF